MSFSEPHAVQTPEAPSLAPKCKQKYTAWSSNPIAPKKRATQNNEFYSCATQKELWVFHEKRMVFMINFFI